MKRFISIFCAAIMVLTISGCQKQTDSVENSLTDFGNTVFTGRVTAVNGTTVTLQLGELTEEEISRREGQEPPEGERPREGQEPPEGEGFREGQEPPEGEGFREGQEPPEGEGPREGQEPPEDGSTLTTLPSGQGTAGKPSSGKGRISFTASEETADVDLAAAVITVETMAASTEKTISDIQVGDILVIEIGEDTTKITVTVKNIDTMAGRPVQPEGGFGGSGKIIQGTAANIMNTDGTYTDTIYISTGDDENALRIEGTTVILEGITVNKESGTSSDTENGDFYGMNAALLATDGADATMIGITVNSSAQNGNGIFSYGDGTVVNISNSVITTMGDNSGGIQTTGGGTTNAYNLEITTFGNSSAAIRSDRGGGTVNVDGGAYTSSGYNSPAVYSTAAVTVKNAVLTANNSEALVIEGKNSIILEDCKVTGNMSDTEGASSDINVHNIMIYQSMSGDADVGTSVFTMNGGSLTSNNGDMFYVTNTHCILNLSGVELINHGTEGYLLLVSGNHAAHGWGEAGRNGAQAELTAEGQTLEGNIAVDSISTLTMELKDGTIFTGTLNIIDNKDKGVAVDNNAVISIDSGCTWNLTGNCTVTSVDNNGTIHFNGYTITLADGMVLSE